MPRPMAWSKRALTFNPWKATTLLLACALAVVVGSERVPAAEAAGPARLSKALAALKASKKHLDEAKEPPAPFHAQSLALVGQAISAVEREIKAYEAQREKDKATKDKDGGKDKDKAAKDKDKAAKDKDKTAKDKDKAAKDKGAKKGAPSTPKPPSEEGEGDG